MVDDLLKRIQDEAIKFIDLRFTDTHGKEQHVTLPASSVLSDLFADGKSFDGSSIKGWKSISKSDMLLMPDVATAVKDPFFEEPTLNIRCDVLEPSTMQAYERDPRSLAKRAEAFLRSTNIADTAYFGPEPEFFIFDHVQYDNAVNCGFYRVDSAEGVWNSGAELDGRNKGHRPALKGGYFPVPPVDSSHDLRSAMSLVMEQMGLVVEAHHHEVATGNQNEIATRFNTLVNKADELQIYKYVVHNIADAYGKTATFMPKPLLGDNGNGMHCHQSLSKDGVNLFAGDQYGGLSDEGLFYIGGIIKHARSINAFSNASTNSYKRLVPGFEAPVMLAYSARNRSASIRIPHTADPSKRRIEVRFPDPTANPYLAFAAMLMAGIDGIKNRIHPGDAMDKDLYDLPPEEAVDIATVSTSLSIALDELERDHQYLLDGGVFSYDLIESYVALKREQANALAMTPHPLEFALYYSV